MAKRSVAVIFGGRTPEHEVSILTAHEAMAVLRAMDGYDVVPVYITKGGRWLTGAALNDLDKFADPAQLERDCRPIVLRPMGDRALFVARRPACSRKAETAGGRRRAARSSTARTARTARCRACSRCSASRTRGPACSPPRCAWTRWRRSTC